MPLRKKNSGINTVAGLVILVICLVLSAGLFLNRQHVADQLIVMQYKPSAQIAQIADDAYLSETGTFYFYASQPVLEASQKFNTLCERQEKHNAILGCYADQRIYIFDVQDVKLDGIEEVTAAHEMLHAAWDRMGRAERKEVAKLLESAYKKFENPDLKERMEYYSRAQPGSRSNELHSIIGTEFKDLSPALAAHYAQYFTNRTALVELHDDYKQVFESLEQQSAALVAQLEKLSDTIERLSADYNRQVMELNNDIQSFNQRAESGSFASREGFNRERAVLVDRNAALKKMRASINAKIATYEDLKTQLQDVNKKAMVLNHSLDSTLAPAPKL